MRITIVLAVLAAAGFADSAVIYEFPDGRTVAVLATEDLEMAAESVLITPAGGMYPAWESEEGWLPLMDFWCVFHLVNLTDEPVDVTVGFPLDAKYGDAYSVMPPSMLVEMFDSLHADEGRMPWTLVGPEDGEDATELIPAEMGFTATADGEPLEVSYRTCAWSLEDDLVWKPVMAVWRMHFAPGDTVRLVNTYTTSWDYLGGGTDAWYDLDYVVTTGASWSGPIGYALIRMTVPEALPLPGLTDTLSAAWWWSGSPVVDLDDRTVTWEHRDWEPEENLQLTVSTLLDGGFGWESSPRASSLVAAVEWTPESLLHSAAAHLAEHPSWTVVFHEELVVHLLEHVLAVAENRTPPWPGIARNVSMDVGNWTAPPRAAAAMNAVRRDLEADREIVRSEGLAAFLPLIRFRRGWSEEDLDMFAAMPDLERPFLRVMQALPGVFAGEPSGDPAVDALFRLAGLSRFDAMPWRTLSSLTREQVEAYRATL